MASTNNSGTYDAFGRRDSCFSAVSDTSAYRSDAMYPGSQNQRTVSDVSSSKRPMRLSSAHKRRVSSASITVKSNNIVTIKPANQVSDNAIDEDFYQTSTEYDTPFTASSDSVCSCCNAQNPSHSHDDEYPEKCWEHQTCLPRGGWKKHLERCDHTTCPLPNCSKSASEFATQDKFIKHFVKRHDEKCWYWGKKKNVFGSEKAVWLRWNGD